MSLKHVYVHSVLEALLTPLSTIQPHKVCCLHHYLLHKPPQSDPTLDHQSDTTSTHPLALNMSHDYLPHPYLSVLFMFVKCTQFSK